MYTHTYWVYDAIDQVQRLSNLFPTWITFMICVRTPTIILTISMQHYIDTLIHQVCNATDQLQTLRNLFPSQIAFTIHPNTKPQSLKSRQKIIVLHCYIKHLMQQIRYKCWEISSKQTLHSWSVYAPDHDLWNLDTTLDWYTPICQAFDNATD